ncbi:DUF3347 domain-containing protein [Flavobacterium sp. LB2R40]|uniref:DUF3347 domain-containing protein n=1 Tax=Flavobacterium sp. LB2R40 TaxID=3401722 RepID=UPI003AAFEF30
MRNTILSIVTLAILLISCNEKNKEAAIGASTITKTGSALYACPMHPKVTGKKAAECSECGMELSEKVVSVSKIEPNSSTAVDVKTVTKVATPTTVAGSSVVTDEIVSSYLRLKNALVKDDSKGAATAGKVLYTAINNLNTSSIEPKLKAQYLDITKDAKQHTQHIGDNAGKIDQQRVHFALLSKEMVNLIKTFGTKQKLYQDYCPMYNEGKDGYWISETKEIKNPYFGAEMLSCGRVIQDVI